MATKFLDRLRYLYRAYRYRYRLDPAELKFICAQLRRGQTAVDVGCHKGAYTYWMRQRVGTGGDIVAFEPQPHLAAYLRKTFAMLRYDNVTLVPEGVSSAPGQLKLHIPTTTGTASPGATFVATKAEEQTCEEVDVAVTTLDDFFASRPKLPDLMKIDVEGHELAVLRGGQRTLAASRPTILVECEARHRPDGTVRPVFDFLESLGYVGSFFSGGQRRPLSEFDLARHQHLDADDDKLPADYANNFAFVHPARIGGARSPSRLPKCAAL